MKLNKIAYDWFGGNKEPPYFLLENECAYDKEKIIFYLKSAIKMRSWQEHRICCLGCGSQGSDLGHGAFSDGEWIWKDDLLHMIEAHNIDLPIEFVQAISDKNHKLSIPQNNHTLLLEEQESFENRLRETGKISYSNEAWDQWLTEKKKIFHRKKLIDLKKSIVPFFLARVLQHPSLTPGNKCSK